MDLRRRRALAAAACTLSLVATSVALQPSGAAGAPGAPPTTAKAERSQLSARQLKATGRRTVAKSPTSRMARSDAGLIARKDATPVPVVVKYDYDSVATYKGGVEGARATSPSETGKPLTEKEARSGSYAQVVARKEARINAAVRKAVPSARLGRSLRVVYGGMSMVIPANQARALLKVPGVVAVQEDVLQKKLTDSSPEFVDAPPVWNTLGGQPTAGAGVLFGDLDTGLWPEHPSFAANPDLPAKPTRPGGGDIGCNFGDNPLTPATDVFQCNNKLAGGYAFLDTYKIVNADPEVYPDTARDSDGHGSHTTSTAAGDVVDHATVLGVDRGKISGLAPGAAIVEYKVCGKAGCYQSDSSAAVEQAVLDGVDAINFSIGGGNDPLSDPVELAFLDAYDAGVFVATSAGNDGPDAGTVEHLSPWVTSTAASTQNRAFQSFATVVADDGATYSFTGSSVTDGVSTGTPMVFASEAPYGDELCSLDPQDEPDIPDDVFDGKIVACERGGNARVNKGYNAMRGGAVGMILYNPTLMDTETDNHWLPTVHLADGTALLDFAADHEGPMTAGFTGGEKADGKGDVMASFSSRGPGGAFVKPDIAAPGVQILAGNTPTPDDPDLGPPGEYFQAIAGTSMASPHVAGAGLLLKAAHPDWTPGQIKSALMLTSITSLVKEDESTPADPFDMGAGRIDIAKAASPGLTLDESAENFAALTGTNDGVDLNIASIDAPVMPGELTTSRTFTNVGGGTSNYTITTHAQPGNTITASPSTFTIPAGGSKTVEFTIHANGHDGMQQFGRIDLQAPGRNALHLPVAFIPTQGALTTTSNCDDTTLDFGATAGCDVTVRNDSFADTTASIHSTVNDKLQITDSGPDGTHTATTADVGDIELAGREPGVPSLVDADGFDGFVEIAEDFAPEAIGDEEFLTYDGFGSFVFNGKTYNSVNVNSNGYLVAGPATSEDNVCCPPQNTPDAAPPNNVIAPFWSDLAGDTGTPDGELPLGISAAIFSDDDGNEWLVLESRLSDCCASDTSHGSTKVSQVWLGLNGEQDITIDYPAGATPDTSGIEQAPGDPLAVTAVQNEVGEGDEIVQPADLASDYFVESTDPVPGDSYTLHLGVKGVAAGAGVLASAATSPDVKGTTLVDTAISVAPAPVQGTDAFITRAYQDFLGRDPSAAEVAWVRAGLNRGTTRRAFVTALAKSDEYLSHLVTQKYQQLLGRNPDSGGRAFWVNQLRNGLNERGLVASLGNSNEFFTKSGSTNEGFANRLYQSLLDRPASESEQETVNDVLGSGSTRGGVTDAVYQSGESRMLRVSQLYQHFLHRSPDPGGHSYWSNVILTKGDIVLAIELASSNEYFHRTR